MKKRIRVACSVLCAVLLLCAALLPAAAAAETGGNATVFTFSDDAITVAEGDYGGYKIEGTALTINESGVYQVQGACADGSIKVKKGTTDVTLLLNGLTLTSAATAPICCNKQTKVEICAAAGSVNTLADTACNNDETYPDNADAENAVIKCKDGAQVTLCGTGTINVTANGKNGVKGGADLYAEDADGNATDTLLQEAALTVRDVTLHIVCNADDGLKSDKELNLLSGIITVSAADDAIKSDYTLNIGAEGTDGPTVNVTQSAEGLEGATVNVYSGSVYVNAADDGINAANSDLASYSFAYNQYGGYVWVNCANGDGVDSNGTILLQGGTLEAYSPTQGDGDPLDADGGITLGGATVLAVGNNAMNQRLTASTPYLTFGGNSGRGGFGGMGGAGALVSAGSAVTVCGANGDVLYTGTAVRGAGYVLFSSPLLTAGESYTLKNGGTAAATATAVTGSSGRQTPGAGEQSGFSGNSSILSFFRTILEYLRSFFNRVRSLFMK